MHETPLLKSASQCLEALTQSWADPEGVQGVLTPLKNHKNIACLSNTGSDPLKNHKATKPAFIVGPLSARKPNARRLARGLMIAH